MSTAWIDLGVDRVLALLNAKIELNYQWNADPGTFTPTEQAALDYIEVLESALEHLGIRINDDGSVAPTDPRDSEGRTKK